MSVMKMMDAKDHPGCLYEKRFSHLEQEYAELKARMDNKKEVMCIMSYYQDGDAYRGSSIWKIIFLDPNTLEKIDTDCGIYDVLEEYNLESESWYTVVRGLWPTKEYAEASHESYKVIKWIEIRL